MLIVASLLAAAATLRPTLDRQSEALDITTPAVDERNPELSLLSVATGGLRAPIVNFLWIRTQELKQQGRHYDAYQLASLICRLQPHFPGVWTFHSWNMAWNISVSTHTDEERWLWVSNGMKLLRDEGIPVNRKTLDLYRELGWIFFSKMGDNIDEKHWVYKQRWAAEMQYILGAPPVGEVKQVINAFRPIAEAPLDRDLNRQGAQRFQASALATLMQDANVAAYAAKLAPLGIKLDDSFLKAYNRWSNDMTVAVVRPVIGFAPASTDQERNIESAINSPSDAPARSKILAFLRAQLLWNAYRMDPQWMLHLMEEYQAPLDWRLVWPHALYWVSYGIHMCDTEKMGTVGALNTDRTAMNSLKMLTWYGRMTYIDNPEKPNEPDIRMFADWRYIRPTHEAHVRFAKAVIAARGETFEGNVFKDGHANYLMDAICMLVTLQRYNEAQYWFEWVRTNYKRTDDPWNARSARDFTRKLSERDAASSPNTAMSQITAALETGFLHMISGDVKSYTEGLSYAEFVYEAMNRGAADRLRMQPLGQYAAGILFDLLVQPRALGYNILLSDRSRLYKAVEPLQTRTADNKQFSLQAIVYDWMEQPLRKECKAQSVDFDQAFPRPAELDAFREWQNRRMAPVRKPQ